MINVNQITTMLSRMELPDLQDYAALHKNDPYIVSLAMSVANTKKQAEIAKNGLARMQPQPKVVDQQIAQMTAPQMPPQMAQGQPQMPPQMAQQQLPENTGIGQLPAPNMQAMGNAEGGIIGYAEGGHVPSYAGQTDGSFVYQNSYQYAPNQIGLTNPDGTPMTAAQLNALPEAERMRIAKELREATGRGPMPTGVNPVIPYAPNSGYGNGKLPLPLADIYKAQREKGITSLGKQADIVMPAGPGVSGIDLGGPGAYPGSGGGAAPTAQAAPINPNAPALSGAPSAGVPTNTSPLIKRPPTGTAPLGKPPAGFPSVNAAVNDLMGINGLLPKKEELPDTEAVETKMAGFSAPAFKKTQEFIDKQKSQLKTDKEQDFYMALIEGGLAAASEAGPNALQNIAKGFSKGAGSYATALKDLRKAAQEHGKMEVDLARAEAEDKKGNYKTGLELQEKAKDRIAKRDDAMTSGLFALTGNINHSNAIIQSALISERSHAATAGASSPLALYSALGGGDIEKGLKKHADITGGYHNITAVENMRKNITDELLKLPEYKFDPSKLKIEAQRQLDEQLKKFPNLAQYASVPGPGNAAPGLRYNPQTGKIE